MELQPASTKGDGVVEKKLTKGELRQGLCNCLNIDVEVHGEGVVHSHDKDGKKLDEKTEE